MPSRSASSQDAYEDSRTEEQRPGDEYARQVRNWLQGFTMKWGGYGCDTIGAWGNAVKAGYAAHQGMGTAVQGFDQWMPVILLDLLQQDAQGLADYLLRQPAKTVRFVLSKLDNTVLLKLLKALSGLAPPCHAPIFHMLEHGRREQLIVDADGRLGKTLARAEPRFPAPVDGATGYWRRRAEILRMPATGYLARDYAPREATLLGVLTDLVRDSTIPERKRQARMALADLWLALCKDRPGKLVAILNGAPSRKIMRSLLESVPKKTIKRAVMGTIGSIEGDFGRQAASAYAQLYAHGKLGHKRPPRDSNSRFNIFPDWNKDHALYLVQYEVGADGKLGRMVTGAMHVIF